jgi:hypothetical protein
MRRPTVMAMEVAMHLRSHRPILATLRRKRRNRRSPGTTVRPTRVMKLEPAMQPMRAEGPHRKRRSGKMLDQRTLRHRRDRRRMRAEEAAAVPARIPGDPQASIP